MNQRKTKSFYPSWTTQPKRCVVQGVLMLVLFLLSSTLNAQSLDKKISVSCQNESLSTALKKVEKASGLKLIFAYDEVQQYKVSVKANRQPVRVVLDQLLKDVPFKYSVKDKFISITKTGQDRPFRKDVAVAQQTATRNVKGVVRDADGEPLIGVPVSIGNGNVSTVTDANGNYTLSIPTEETILKFTYVGMETAYQTIPRGSKDVSRDVVMRSDTRLDDVVVTGIYTRNKESFTGSSEIYQAEELKSVGNQNVLQSLKILDPSFILTENNLAGSNPNAELDINVRGTTNIVGLSSEYDGNPNLPLFILDGFETTLSAITDLSMDRVESITILKDAASTAIYGSKAANGVIVVETKKPEAGKLRLQYTGNFTLSWADLSDYNMMNAQEKLEYEYKAGYYGELDETGTIINEVDRANYYNKLFQVKSGRDTYWMNEPLQLGFTQSHNLFAEGGDAALRYGVGVNYQNITGVMKNSDRDIINGNFRLTYRIKKLSVTNQTNITNTKTENPMFNFADFVQTNPFYTKYNDNGEVYKVCDSYFTGKGYTLIYTNPMWDMYQKSYDRSSQLSFVNNFQMEYNPINPLIIRGRFGLNVDKTESKQFLSPEMIRFMNTASEEKGSYTESNGSTKSYNGSLDVIFGNTWGHHLLNMIGGAQVRENKYDLSGYSVYGYSSDNFSNPNFSLGFREGGRPSSTISKTRSASFYLNMNYSYHLRYLVDFNLRSDGASVFGVDNPFSTTWSLGLAYNVHNESFFPKNDVVNSLRLRYSIGNPGNQNFDAKLASDVYIYSTAYPNMFGLATNVLKWGNTGLRWQRSQDQNWGIDLQMFKNRLRLTADYFIKKTDPLLLDNILPPSSGVTSIPMNVGAMKNQGFTIIANYAILKSQDLNWNILGNLRHIRTTYYDLGDLLEQYNESGRSTNSLKRYYDGSSATALWAVPSVGIDPATGNEIFVKKDGSYTYEWNVEDEIVCGDNTPDLEGSFGTSFFYKGFSFNVNFTYRFGGQLFMSTLYNKVENINAESVRYNQDKRALYNRWQKPGDISTFKRIDDTSYTPMSSRFIGDENTLQCSNLSIGYQTTTANWLKSLGMTGMSIRIYGTDLFRLSTIKEERGINYPFARSVSASLSLNF